MKEEKYISQFMLELYHLNAVTDEERKAVEEGLSRNDDVRLRYDELKKADMEIKERYALNTPPGFTVIRNNGKRRMLKNKKLLISAAAAVLCLCVSAFLYFSNLKSSGGDSGIATETGGDKIINRDTNEENEKIVISPRETKKAEPGKDNEPALAQEPVINEKEHTNEIIAVMPNTEQEVYTRGGSGNPPQQEKTVQASGNPTSSITIPPGLTTIFDNMFSGRQLTEVIIPGRITAIGKNAFADNPLVDVTIGAHVTVDDEAIPGNFAKVYNGHGRTAGTYTRPNANSNEWNLIQTYRF